MRQIYLLIFFSWLSLLSVVSNSRVLVNDESCESRCNDDVLVYHLASTEILSPESIINLSVKEIEPLCRKLDDTLKEIDKYLKTCVPPPPGNLFMSYIAGLRVMFVKMCAPDSDYVKRFGPCYACLHELKNEFDGCSGPADWTEEPDIAKVCKTYKNIADCYYIKAAKVCGVNAAIIIKELVLDVIDNVLCTTCKGVRKNPYVKDAMPEKYIRGEATYLKINVITIISSLSISFI